MNEKPDLAALFGAPSTSTFLGLQPCNDLASVDASSAFIGAPCATPYGSVGAYARNGPQSLRQSIASFSANLDRHNFDLGGQIFPNGTKPAVDCGDLAWSETDFAMNRDTIRSAVRTVVRNGVVPILIGGDDSIPIPMLEGLGDTGKSYTVLQIDAHIDWRQEHMGERLGLSSTMRRASEMDHIDAIVQVGARGMGSAHPDDVADALSWGAKLITAEDIHKNGVDPIFDHISTGANIILCFDIDALDPSIAPNTIGRTPGGLQYYQVLDVIKGAFSHGTVAAIDVVEILPEVDIDGLGAMTVSRLVANMMGLLARQQARV